MYMITRLVRFLSSKVVLKDDDPGDSGDSKPENDEHMCTIRCLSSPQLGVGCRVVGA